MPKVLVTGAGGLIGSEAVSFFCKRDFDVVGIDNNMREYFFGEHGSVLANIQSLQEKYSNMLFYDFDIRNASQIETLFSEHTFDLIIHAAGQPSHDWAVQEPITDFSVNAHGTLLLLEHTRTYCPEAVFILLSTNKVYGDHPNALPFIELESRFELPETHSYYSGIDEKMSIDQCKHSLFGASKVAADILVQEFGRYFDMNTAVLRGSCLTGALHAGVELHGFLSYLVKCIVHNVPYTIYGYKGKQVRDNMHSFDVINACYHFFMNPKNAAVYNIGGSRFSNISVLEAIDRVEQITGCKSNVTYKDEPRSGDHIWYISDMSKFRKDYPDWDCTIDIDQMLAQMCEYEVQKRSECSVKVSKI